MVEDTWSPTASMRTLKYFLADAAKHKEKSSSIRFHWSILVSQSKEQSLCQVGYYIYRLFSRICKVLWKSLEIVEVHVWHE